MSTTDDASRCAACGEGGDALNVLFEGCNLVKYCCNAECEERAAEIYDEILFRDPPRKECPLCCIPLPHENDGKCNYSCFGSVVCIGCLQGMVTDDVIDAEVCPFCRVTVRESDDEYIERLRRRMKNGDGRACFDIARLYHSGGMGFPQSYKKGLELGLRAGELGCSDGFHLLGRAFIYGEGVFRDDEKAVQYMGLSAIGGDLVARCYLGDLEAKAGFVHRALKHFTIAARAGWETAPNDVKKLYMDGHATKDEYRAALLAFQNAKDEMKNVRRDTVKSLLALKKIQDEMKSVRDT